MRTHFVIFKNDSRYSITECSGSGVKQAFVKGGCVSGDGSVLLRLSRLKPENVSMESYIEENAGRLVFEPSPHPLVPIDNRPVTPTRSSVKHERAAGTLF